MNQTTIDFSKQVTEAAINRAVDHADAVHGDWSEQAFFFLKRFILCNRSFMAEDVRAASAGVVPEPPSNRAWGAVILRAARQGLIRKMGYKAVKNIRAHRTPATVWEANSTHYGI